MGNGMCVGCAVLLNTAIERAPMCYFWGGVLVDYTTILEKIYSPDPISAAYGALPGSSTYPIDQQRMYRAPSC
jgi:hypothetical protein